MLIFPGFCLCTGATGVLDTQKIEAPLSCPCSKPVKREIKRSQVDEAQNVILTPDKSYFGWYGLEMWLQ